MDAEGVLLNGDGVADEKLSAVMSVDEGLPDVACGGSRMPVLETVDLESVDLESVDLESVDLEFVDLESVEGEGKVSFVLPRSTDAIAVAITAVTSWEFDDPLLALGFCAMTGLTGGRVDPRVKEQARALPLIRLL